MKDQDSGTSASQTEGEMDEEMDGEGETAKNQSNSPAPRLSSLYAVIRIKQKYQALKKRRQDLDLVLGGVGSKAGAPTRTSAKIFTFDGLITNGRSSLPSTALPKKKRKRRVLFPSGGGRRAPPKQYSPAKYCLYLLFAIVCIQVTQ